MTELGLFACAVATSFGLVRIFGDLGYMPRAALVAATSLALAALLRRRGVGIVPALITHTAAGVVVVSNLFLARTTTWGLPNARTWAAVRQIVPEAFAELRTAVPPVPARPGTLLVLAAVLWLLCLFADSAALRAHAPVQAALPFCVSFLALGVPDSDIAETSSVLVLAGGLALYTVAVQHTRDLSLSWTGDGAARGRARLTGTAFVLAVGAVAVALLAILLVPSRPPLVNLRQPSLNSGREVTTPFVSIRSLLGPRRNTGMFTVRTAEPSYWRTTALDVYDRDRDLWVSSGKYSPVRGRLPASTDPTVPVDEVRQEFDIQGLGGPWVPAAFEPAEYEGGPRVTYRAETGTLFAEKDLTRGQDYSVVSRVPQYDVDTLRRAAPDFRRRARSGTDGSLPPFSSAERSLLAHAFREAPDAYSGLLALQNIFRESFVYDESVDYSRAADPTREFLVEGRGFCQQFASTFALMARRVGLASRVAVGFTMGEILPGDRGTGDTHVYLVKGLHAHAWPEVLFPGVGWVPFEPTPGRGNPTTSGFTGVAAGQATDAGEEPETSSTTATTTTTTVPPTSNAEDAAAASTTTVAPRSDAAEPGPAGGGYRRGSPLWLLPLVLALALAVGLGLRRRRSAPAEPEFVNPVDEAVWSAWHTALAGTARLGLVPAPSETPLEFASRVGRVLAARTEESLLSGRHDGATLERVGTSLAAQLSRLAEFETERRYSPRFAALPQTDRARADGLLEQARVVSAAIDAACTELVEGVVGVVVPLVTDVTH